MKINYILFAGLRLKRRETSAAGTKSFFAFEMTKTYKLFPCGARSKTTLAYQIDRALNRNDTFQ